MRLEERDLLLLCMPTVGLIDNASLVPGAEMENFGLCVFALPRGP
jgi:hypothetical protein